MHSPAARRYGAAAASGLLLSLAFAPAEIAGAAWIAPGLMAFCAIGGNGKAAFRVGFAGGLAHFLSSLYWLLAMPFDWHGIPLAPGLAWVLLSAYCALYFAVWVWFCWRTFPGEIMQPGLPVLAALDKFLSTPVWKRAGWTLLCALAWTALEFTRGVFLTGFPWNPLGATQYTLLPLIQVASITGVYGVAFIVVWFSMAICSTLIVLARKPQSRPFWADAALPILAVAGAVSFGLGKCLAPPAATRHLKVAMVQPSIPQTLIFNPADDEKRFADLLAQSEQALESKPDILMWPESAVPPLTEDTQRAIGRLLEKHPVWLVFCSDSSDVSPSGAPVFYNSSFLVSPKGAVEGIYHKRRLVIFGEYIPLARWLPFLRWFSPIGNDGFTPGDKMAPFDLAGLGARISTLICFEDTFPQEARLHVTPDTDFLVNLTNDGWFGTGPEQKQHAVMALFRAVENGVPLARCTNDGLTCWIDAVGRIQELRDAKGGIYGPGFMTAEIPLRGANGRQTFYNRHGDLFAWGCGVSFLAVFLRRREPAEVGNLSNPSSEMSKS
jgi:apolipoprotein N-acyltransferase